jgi:hypothetical protein
LLTNDRGACACVGGGVGLVSEGPSEGKEVGAGAGPADGGVSLVAEEPREGKEARVGASLGITGGTGGGVGLVTEEPREGNEARVGASCGITGGTGGSGAGLVAKGATVAVLEGETTCSEGCPGLSWTALSSSTNNNAGSPIESEGFSIEFSDVTLWDFSSGRFLAVDRFLFPWINGRSESDSESEDINVGFVVCTIDEANSEISEANTVAFFVFLPLLGAGGVPSSAFTVVLLEALLVPAALPFFPCVAFSSSFSFLRSGCDITLGFRFFFSSRAKRFFSISIHSGEGSNICPG